MKDRAAAERAMVVIGDAVGRILESHAPAVPMPQMTIPLAIPKDDLEELTECFMILIAEAIQSWIDAGSEREVTLENEELHDAIYKELKGWSSVWEDE